MSNRFRILLVCIVLILGAFLPHGKGIAAAGSVTIATDTVNVRSGPGLSYPLLKQAKRGEKYQIVKEKGDWIEIQLSFGKTGWVVNWLITKENETQAAAPSVTGTSSTVAKAKDNQLRVRSGPGTSFSIIGFLTKGQEAPILGQNENWYKIASPFGEGWIAKELVEVTAGKQKQVVNSTAPTSQNTGIVKGDTLNVRKEPSSTGAIVGKLTKGTSVTVLTKKNSWLEVSFLNLKGWVSAEFIDIQTASAKAPAKKEPTGLAGTVTAASLSVRADPSLNSAIIGAVSKGNSFTIIEEKNDWAKIEFKSGSVGWVAGWYLDKTAAQKSNVGQAVQENKITILHNGTNIRKDPNVQSDVLVRANEGETFSISGIQNDWYKLKLKDGKTGYVAGWVVANKGAGKQIEKAGAGGYLKNKTIVLDPGHGGGDNGTTGARGTLEKELTLRTARLLYDKLSAAGANVYLTRNNDSFIPLPSRVSIAQSKNADAFISLHYDSNLEQSVRGMTGYYYHSYQKPLAEHVFSATAGMTKLKNRGVRIGDYHVVRENSQKAVLMELGYLSNPEEEMMVNSSAFQENAASGIYQGLARYFKNN